MYRDRTKAYFDAYKGHRAALTAICETFDKAIKAIEPYKGSAGYTKDKKALEKTRDDAIKALTDEYSVKFTEIINGMIRSVDMVQLKAPTPDMLAILQTLKMRDKVEAGELNQAARALRDNPLALAALDEIADKYRAAGVPGIDAGYRRAYGGETTTTVSASIKRLKESASRMLALRRPNSRIAMTTAAMRELRDEGTTAKSMRAFLADRDFDNENEAVNYFGGVHDIESFKSFVNND